MQRSFLAVAAVLVLSASAEARIGETDAQIHARYGDPIAVLPTRDDTPGLTKCYSAEGYIIAVTSVKGRSVREILTKANSAKITDDEIQTALKANARGAAWDAAVLTGRTTVPVGVRAWRTGEQEARVAFYDAQTRALFITTQPFIDKANAPRPKISVREAIRDMGRSGGRATRDLQLMDKGSVLRGRDGAAGPAASPAK
ncbi:MAG: hypothetical protein ABI897_13080 [Spartobacteria bacterium]